MSGEIVYINCGRGFNRDKKVELINKYIEIWKTDPDAFAKRKANTTALRAILFPEKFGITE